MVRKWTGLLCLIALLGGVPLVACAQEGDWIKMFDGKTLDGWKINENEKSWRVEDGSIVANGERSHLFYVGDGKPFKNFHFEAEVMTKKNSNSGIYFHAKYLDSGWPVQQGYECQVNNSYNSDPQKTAGLYNRVRVLEPAAKDDVYFKYEIIVNGQRIITKIDGKTIVDYSQPKDSKEAPVLGEGSFALQAHDPGSTVYFKNLRVKRLP
jgi:hypothetical protein